ncbi:hypothetical protein ABEW68_33040 [Paenibacillus lautus]|uniref:hypothetical protein n=1 Tax=Paenibacillus lautus TaxID=1401 RepID=UPI003D267F79
MAMTSEETLVQLNKELGEIRNAITAILGGAQEYRIGNHLVRRADLRVLYAERTRLEKEISLIESGGMFRTVYFEGR